MKAAVIRFPGSNCDQDCVLALRDLGVPVEFVWHKQDSLVGYDLIVLPGGVLIWLLLGLLSWRAFKAASALRKLKLERIFVEGVVQPALVRKI